MIELAEFTIPKAPPSNNDDVFKTRAGRIRVAGEWRDLINLELEQLGLPRPIPMEGPLRVFVTVRFRVERGQEAPNYYDFFMKRLGDCLRGGHPNYYGLDGEEHAEERARICAEHPVGWILDDKDHHWTPSFAINRVKPRPKGLEGATTVRLMWMDPARKAGLSYGRIAKLETDLLDVDAA
jgi:hypothetical protein